MTASLRTVVLSLAPVVLAGVHCSRNVELARGDGGSGVLPPGNTAPALPDGGIPRVDSGLGSDAWGACAERPLEPACAGQNDYPCAPAAYVDSVLESCQRDAGCVAGWVELQIGDGGCFEAVGMDPLDDAFVRCVADALGPSRCPCTAQLVTRFLATSTLEFDSCP